MTDTVYNREKPVILDAPTKGGCGLAMSGLAVIPDALAKGGEVAE